ncbi:MAG: GDP-mannose 4,6-dehydratase [Candidatus Doudnabacteria bacterium]|nr:GDP-mannose 4,6-dehydratase [Candidatus Doudnabacteria bacterium]
MKALIIGVTGQDGSYLAELLLQQGYQVRGTLRRVSYFNTARIDHLYANANFDTFYADLTDPVSIANIVGRFQPDEIYNLAGMSHVRVSFEMPSYTLGTNTLGLLHILEYLRQHAPRTKLYQASSSEMFGLSRTPPPFNEHSEMRPQSPYGVSKLAAFHLARNYRDGYGLYAATGILFNHESPRRGETFVTRKITRGIAAILRKETKELKLGNIKAIRDWGHAKDYVRAIHLIMQQPQAGEYVVATGQAHSVKEALEFCFNQVGLNWQDYVVQDKKYLRPNEVPYLEGDARKIRALGWQPEYDWQATLQEMLEHDIRAGGVAPSKYIV